MRSMWKGSISFGLVTIPIKLYAATESRDVSFNLLHEECGTPIQYKKWCPSCDREITAEEITRGYEFERGRYVTIAEGDLEAVPVAAARTLEIVDFVRLEQIDPVYFQKTYYLEPGEGGAKAYALLRRAMELTGRIAIARIVIRSKESLAAIRVFREGVLAMETMHFPDEVRSSAGLTGIVEPELRPQELEMATGLVASLAGDFDPAKFQNQYRAAVLNLIQAKVTGQEVLQASDPVPAGRVADLMDALRASIRIAQEARGTEAGTAGVPAVPAGTPGLSAAPSLAAAPPAVPGLPAAPGAPAMGRPLTAAPVPGSVIPGAPGPGSIPPPGNPGAAPPQPGSPPAAGER